MYGLENSGNRTIQDEIYIKKPEFEIMMEAEQTIATAGQDSKLVGKCKAILEVTADGTYFLEPEDKTRNMQMQEEKGIVADANGSSQILTAPFTYFIPFLFR